MRAFFGESMFHRARDASKVALVHLVARLKAGGFRLLDTQFVTDHLRIFGAVEVPRRQYHKLLEAALAAKATSARLAPGSRSRECRRLRCLPTIARVDAWMARAAAHGSQLSRYANCDQRRGAPGCGAACGDGELRRGAAGGFAGVTGGGRPPAAAR